MDTLTLAPELAARLKRDPAGLVPAIAQQHDTGEVLMLGWVNDEALRRSLESGRATYWSRSRQEYWRKGDTSGNVQHLLGVALDCDGDALLFSVDQVGPVCHTGTKTCFTGRGVPMRPSQTNLHDDAGSGSPGTLAGQVLSADAPRVTGDPTQVGAR